MVAKPALGRFVRSFAWTFVVLAGVVAGPAAGAESFVSNGVKISYTERGAGEPVVLIHGWLASGAINWDLPGISVALAKDHQVLCVDMPGHGRSDKPTKDEAYGPELAEHVVRLLDHRNLKQAHLVGYSMGGLVAAYCAAKHPTRVRSVLIGGMGWLREGSFEQKLFAAGKGDLAVGVCFRNLAKLALTEPEIRSIRTPVQVVFGEKDILRNGYVRPLENVRPDWRVIDIPDADHLTCVAKPQFRDAIHEWLSRQRRP